MWDNAFHYFYEAASLGSMRLASEKIGVAVSSISRQIGQLEAAMGVSLIERGRRSIRLTDAGRLVFDFHREQLSDRESLMNRLQELREVKTGHIVLAIGEGFIGNAFARTFDQFQRRNPGIAITIHSYTSSEIIRMVLEDEVHIGMILHVPDEPKIRTRLAVNQPLLAMCAPNHPAAELSAITLEDLTRFDLCLPPKGFRIRSTLIHAERRARIMLEPMLVTSSIQIMREVAKAGRVITVLPRISALTELAEGSLVARPLLDPELEHTSVSLIHRLGRQLDGAPARLLSQLENSLKSWASIPVTATGSAEDLLRVP
ncbi:MULTISPECIES: LysR family transcriptional regulator [unclassified Sphingomonas]|uniref:LysR family transcriptional regulator n=1 Tax=unclassified Sphingomonas TaxID=196159 RepID=UPI0006F24A10|nr:MULTISPECIES: LysR family transcriptional regulator [unclassified Sphingomonas]KQX25092.1 LysR family transcriptional regulator [Sphingomonas sp. Root1294]KQY66109.1 LysR family transcriptional regulator [Sphingomonas sp. Root50]KRB89727.1 LysR family transcriptional regulator [Sphingomonas sp. Root720]